jgi:hypothetical protein
MCHELRVAGDDVCGWIVNDYRGPWLIIGGVTDSRYGHVVAGEFLRRGSGWEARRGREDRLRGGRETEKELQMAIPTAQIRPGFRRK